MVFMGKRSVSGSNLGKKLRAVLDAIQSGRHNPVSSIHQMAQVLESRRMMSSTPAVVTVDWQGHSIQAYQDQYVAETLNASGLQKLATKEGFTAVTSLGGSGYYSLDSSLPVTTLEKLVKDHPVILKELSPNAVNQLASTVPDDPDIVNQWGLINTGQVEPYDYYGTGVVTPYNEVQNPTPPAEIDYPSPPYPNDNRVGTVGQDINATKAWDITTGSKNVVVAILDSGIDLTNPDLTANIWTNPLDTTANGENGDGFPDDTNGWNFVNSDNDVQDTYGHGTAVAGVIGAAGNNGLGGSGVDWNVSLLSVVVADDTGAVSDANEISGINYCVTLKNLGINIVVMNESVAGADEYPQNVLISDALKQAAKAGILDVAAAGNDGDPIAASGVNLDASASTPAAFGTSNPNIITVAATDNTGQLASFSNYGAATVDLAAPGVDIYTTSPVADSTLNDEISANNPDIPQFGTTNGYLSGTSMSAPFVTGIIALEAAANPSASPAQLKQALLGGTTYDPYLAATNGTPAKVATSGVANAYNAVQNILNDYVSTDTVRQGSWSNFYGSNGAYVVGESTSFPSFVTVNQTGGSPVILDDTTKNLAGLELTTDPTQRISAYEAAASTESINMNFTDGQAHQVALYIADLDNKKRVETVELIDNVSGDVLNAQTISKFKNGEYLLYDLRGNVSLKLVNDSGPGVVYSGLFFDPTTTDPTTYSSTDTTTTGENWRNSYGSQGAIVVGNSTQLPSYVNFFSVVGDTAAVLKPTTTTPSALEKITDVNTGIEAYWSTTTHMDLNLQTNDGLTHVVTLYLADYDKKKRQERIQLIDSPTGDILSQVDVNNFSKGEYVSFRVSGDVTFRIIDTAGPSAVVSGVFFDAPFGEKVSFAGTDTTTGGNWLQSQYGLNSAYVPGYNFPDTDVPTNTAITVTGASESVLAEPTNNPAAVLLEQANPAYRIESYLVTTTTMVLAYNPGDFLIHEVALYFADFQKYHRVETVTLTDPATLKVITSQTVSNFSKGKYLVFDVSGQVLITISNGSYPDAVLSGIFTN
jgi:subtilisin family serine protease